MFVYVFIYAHTHIHVYITHGRQHNCCVSLAPAQNTYLHTYTDTQINKHIWLYTCMYTYLYTCICIYVLYIYTRTYTCIYVTRQTASLLRVISTRSPAGPAWRRPYSYMLAAKAFFQEVCGVLCIYIHACMQTLSINYIHALRTYIPT